MAGVTAEDVRKANEAFAATRGAADIPEYSTGIPDTLAYVEARGLPWHGVGKPASALMTVDEALELGGADFEVVRRPIFTHDVKGRIAKIEGMGANVRADTGRVLGVVGKQHRIHQNRTSVEFALSVVDTGEARLDTLGTLKGGEFVFASLVLEGLDLTIAGEVFEGYALVTNSHNGQRSYGLDMVLVRAVCTNSVNAALAGAVSSFRWRHTSGLEGRVQQAREALQVGYKLAADWKIVGDKLALERVVESQVESILRAAFPVRDDVSDAQRERTLAFAMLRDWQTSDNLADVRETAWGVLQAGIEVIDHGVERKGGDDARAYALLYGDGIRQKTRLLKAVREFAEV